MVVVLAERGWVRTTAVGYHCSSRNNVNVEQPGDRCFVKTEKAEIQMAGEDRARVSDISLTPL